VAHLHRFVKPSIQKTSVPCYSNKNLVQKTLNRRIYICWEIRLFRKNTSFNIIIEVGSKNFKVAHLYLLGNLTNEKISSL